jgi:hypothetical protein
MSESVTWSARSCLKMKMRKMSILTSVGVGVAEIWRKSQHDLS